MAAAAAESVEGERGLSVFVDGVISLESHEQEARGKEERMRRIAGTATMRRAMVWSFLISKIKAKVMCLPRKTSGTLSPCNTDAGRSLFAPRILDISDRAEMPSYPTHVGERHFSCLVHNAMNSRCQQAKACGGYE